jgi:hypothetical protein
MTRGENMNAELKQIIFEKLDSLDEKHQFQVLDFIEFLQSRQTSPASDPDVISSLRGKYRDIMSSSEEFARRKQEEIELEEAKWKRRTLKSD